MAAIDRHYFELVKVIREFTLKQKTRIVKKKKRHNKQNKPNDKIQIESKPIYVNSSRIDYTAH